MENEKWKGRGDIGKEIHVSGGGYWYACTMYMA